MQAIQRELLPIRAISDHQFCARLFWLQYVEDQQVENHHMMKGEQIHRQVDRPGGEMCAPEEGEQPWHTRSLWLSDEALALSGRLDLVQQEGDLCLPVDFKKGHARPDGGLWPSDQTQLVLQALLLRAKGYEVQEIAAYYHGNRRRVRLPLSQEMAAQGMAAIEAARKTASGVKSPAPLEDSKRCVGCAMNGVCLPDEWHALQALISEEISDSKPPLRTIRPAHIDGESLYIHGYATKVSLRSGCLLIHHAQGSKSEREEVGLPKISEVNLMGQVQITTAAMQALMKAEIPLFFFTHWGWYLGQTAGMGQSQVQIRIAQYRAFEADGALAVSRRLIADKIHNGRVLLRRNGGADEALLSRLKALSREALRAKDNASLLGIEGYAAALYWPAFATLVNGEIEGISMLGRTRRPPEDAVNAILGYLYAILSKDCALALASVGFDIHLGLYHKPGRGRPALAFDLMEVFRPLIVESCVLKLIKRGEIKASDFEDSGQAILLRKSAKKSIIKAYERRMKETITHPQFGYALSYRRILRVQARLLSRYLLGEFEALPPFRTR